MVYFIRQGDYIKIGYTNNIKTRLTQIQLSSPVKLEVIGLIQGDKETEQQTHKRFKKWNTSGEWFFFCDEIKSYVYRLDKELLWKYGFTEFENVQQGLISRIRRERKMSLQSLAKKLNITKQSVYEIEQRDLEGKITTGLLSKVLSVMGYKFEVRAKSLSDK